MIFSMIQILLRLPSEACHQLPASTELRSPILQILSLGWMWTFFHCSPMCGPIVCGLQIGKDGVVRGLLLYQSGRAIVYGAAGAAAGWIGSSEIFDRPAIGWLLVVLIFAMSLWQWRGSKNDLPIPRSIFHFWSRITSGSVRSCRPFVLGMLLGFLPCMLSIWALGLAASTRTIVGGLSVMLILIGLTTLPLFLSLCGAKFFFFRAPKLSRILLPLSALWILLVTTAANGYIAHRHLNFDFLGRSFTMMFW